MTLRDNFEIWLNSQADPSAALAFIRDEYKTDEETKLAEFATAARALVPYDIKTLPEEKEENGVKTKMVDSFLYPDDVLDDWCDEGKFSRTYCKKYPEEEIDSYNFMSDSFSIDELSYLFGSGVLGKTEGKQLLDIGSRFGACIQRVDVFFSIFGVLQSPQRVEKVKRYSQNSCVFNECVFIVWQQKNVFCENFVCNVLVRM